MSAHGSKTPMTTHTIIIGETLDCVDERALEYSNCTGYLAYAANGICNDFNNYEVREDWHAIGVTRCVFHYLASVAKTTFDTTFFPRTILP